MSTPDDAAATPALAADPDAPARLRRLLPRGEPVSAGEFVDDIDLARVAHARPTGQRPDVMLDMVSTVDGRASIDGHSGALGNRADRELFHALRAAVDGVLV